MILVMAATFNTGGAPRADLRYNTVRMETRQPDDEAHRPRPKKVA
jgi:hypothetical protein